MEKLKEIISAFSESITILNTAGYEKQCLFLLLTFIDHLGYLTSPTEYSDGNDFKNWLKNYCNFDELRCTSEELWNTRCSLLHMGTAEHKHFNSEKHFRLGFYQNKYFSEKELIAEENKHSKPTKYVDLSKLFCSINSGIEKFLYDIESNPDLKLSVLRKSNSMNDLYRFSQ